MVKGLQVNQVIEAETPCHSIQVHKLVCALIISNQLSEVTEKNDQEFGNQASLFDESQIFFISLVVRIEAVKRLKWTLNFVELQIHQAFDKSDEIDGAEALLNHLRIAVHCPLQRLKCMHH